MTVLGAFGLQPLLRSLISLPLGKARVVVSIALIAPVSVGLGVAMPAGLRRFEALHPTGVPYAWGVNGVASVVASVLGVALAINFGFALTSLVAAACYLGASAHAAFGRWPEVADAAPQAMTSEQLAEPEAELAQG